MALPKENRQHAERDRQRHLGGKTKVIELPDYSSVIQKLDEKMCEAEKMVATGMYGISSGPDHSWYEDYIVTPGSSGTSVVVSYPDGYAAYAVKDVEARDARIKELETLLSERDEIIEALVADMEEIESLKKENTDLREQLFALPIKGGPIAGWTAWSAPMGVTEAKAPVPGGTMLEVILRYYGGAPRSNFQLAENYFWNECGDSTITYYRIVP